MTFRFSLIATLREFPCIFRDSSEAGEGIAHHVIDERISVVLAQAGAGEGPFERCAVTDQQQNQGRKRG